MANLSCIHIPGEVFQSSDFRTQSSIWDKAFLKKLLTASFCKKAPLKMCDWVLNTPGLFLYAVYYGLLEF